jgi:hypothetical protein
LSTDLEEVRYIQISQEGGYRAFDAGVIDVEKDFATPNILCMITYANRALGNLRSDHMMYCIILGAKAVTSVLRKRPMQMRRMYVNAMHASRILRV